MTAKKFSSVFERISLSAHLLAVFEETVVRSLLIHKKERTIVMELDADYILHPSMLQELQKELIQQLPGVQDVHIFPKYHFADKQPKEILADFWEAICKKIANTGKICSGIISDADWQYEDGKLQILVKHNMAYYLSQKKLDDAVAKLVQESVGLPITVQFKNVQWRNKKNFNKKNSPKQKNCSNKLQMQHKQQNKKKHLHKCKQ